MKPSPTPRPARTAGTLAAMLLLAAGAQAQVINVTELVTGTYEQTPLLLGSTFPAVPCDTLCKHLSVTSAGYSPSYTATPDPYLVGAWPLAFGNSASYIPVSEPGSVALPPAGITFDGGAAGVANQAQVRFTGAPLLYAPRDLSTQTWMTGSGAVVASYAIRMTTPKGHASTRTYLSFGVPASLRSFQVPWALGGPSGFENVYERPRNIQARSAVDVYVNGLAVWSSEDALVAPRNGFTKRLQWGEPLGTGRATLYLGTLPPGSKRTVALVIRSEHRADAPNCTTQDNFNGDKRLCYSHLEGLTLPSVKEPGAFTFHQPDIEIYTR